MGEEGALNAVHNTERVSLLQQERPLSGLVRRGRAKESCKIP